MAKTTIEWADFTFNPWIGCTRVSDGCQHCYAERYGSRFGVEWGPSGDRRRTSEDNWKKPIAWNKKAEREGRRYSVFCASLADVFDDHESISTYWRDQLSGLIYDTPHLDWLLLTKRPENLRKAGGIDLLLGFESCFFQNVRIGVTVENQEQADRRIPALLSVWDGPNFVSYEPALGPLDLWNVGAPLITRHGLEQLDCLDHASARGAGRRAIDWIIAGGESGPGARPAHPDWFRSVRDQCRAAGVPFFFKQWGDWLPSDEVARWPKYVCEAFFSGREPWAYQTIGTLNGWWRVGKTRAGRLLDGREWNERP